MIGRVTAALREWLEVRRRVREEFRFHLDRAAQDLRELGLTARTARRKVRARMGGRRYRGVALRELGGDAKGLIQLLRAHRVGASLLMQPLALALAGALFLAASPAPRDILTSLARTPAVPGDQEVVFLSAHGPYPWGLSSGELDALASMRSVSALKPYRRLYARGRVNAGVTIDAVQAEARARTGHRRIWAQALTRPHSVPMEPIGLIWSLLAMYGAICALLRGERWRGGLSLYAAAVTGLHALVSSIAWGFANEVMARRSQPESALAFALLLLAFAGAAAMQCRYAWGGLCRRCPICLDRLVLPLTEGRPDRVLLDSVVTESLCAHGHGVMVASRWSRSFRTSSPNQFWPDSAVRP